MSNLNVDGIQNTASAISTSATQSALTNGSGNIEYNIDAVTTERGAAVGGPTYGQMFNIQQGGQLGIGPRIVSMDGGTPLPLNCAMVYVVQAPRFWDRFPATQRTYKSLMELHATSIDGIDLNYTAEFSDVEVGHDGQVASMPLMTKRAPISPTVTMNEIGGNICWNLHYMWLKHTSHPDTCASLLSAMYGEELEQWVWSTFTASWLVVQPDPTGLPSRIVDAFVITNIFPQETGNLGVKRAVGQTPEVPKRSISYKGIITHNESTRELGRLATLACGAHSVNLDYALTYNGVRSNIGQMGHHEWMNRAMQDTGHTGHAMTSGYKATEIAQADMVSSDVSTVAKTAGSTAAAAVAAMQEALADSGITSDTSGGIRA